MMRAALRGSNTGKKDRRQATDRLISGKLRAKAGRSGAAATTVAVDGTDYAWSYRHAWQVWGKDLKVVSISVSLHPERTRELILDLALKVSREDGVPSDARMARALEAGIRSAREAGWDPESRGRAFRHEMADGVR